MARGIYPSRYGRRLEGILLLAFCLISLSLVVHLERKLVGLEEQITDGLTKDGAFGEKEKFLQQRTVPTEAETEDQQPKQGRMLQSDVIDHKMSNGVFGKEEQEAQKRRRGRYVHKSSKDSDDYPSRKGGKESSKSIEGNPSIVGKGKGKGKGGNKSSKCIEGNPSIVEKGKGKGKGKGKEKGNRMLQGNKTPEKQVVGMGIGQLLDAMSGNISKEALEEVRGMARRALEASEHQETNKLMETLLASLENISRASDKEASNRKRQCNVDPYGYGPVLSKIKISPKPSRAPKILCFVNTHEDFHYTKANAVFETWGPNCDKLVFASSKANDALGAVRIPNTGYEYADLWNKHRETLRYIYETYKDEYDWFFKADDDTFVIVENLREYLDSREIREQHEKGVPLHIGNPVTMYVDEHGIHDGDRTVHDEDLLSSFLDRAKYKFTFNVGGAGYAMNSVFMENMVKWIDQKECAPTKNISTLLDDSMLTICSSSFGAFPYEFTRDESGRERFHQESPHTLYTLMPDDPVYKSYQGGKRYTGGFQSGEECCSSKSITFHHLEPDEMRVAHDMLHLCREEDSLEKKLRPSWHNLREPSDALRTSEWPPRATVNRIADAQNRVIILTLNCEYLDFGDNLIASMLQFGVTNFVLVPFDEVSYQALHVAYPDNVVPPMPGFEDLGTASAIYGTDHYGDMVSTRPRMLRSFTEAGYTIFYNDVDLVWRTNLLELMDEAMGKSTAPRYEAIFVEDNGEDWGEICSCMIYLLPTRINIDLLKGWESLIKSERSKYNQKPFNQAIENRKNKMSFRTFNGTDFFPSGKEYFELWDDEKRSHAHVVHNNWIDSKWRKYYRFTRANLWNPSGHLDRVSYSCHTKDVKAKEKPFLSRRSRNVSSLQNRTLVALLGGVRGGEPSWNSLYEHLLDVNSADLALVVGEEHSRTSSLYQRANYVWSFPEYDDWSKAIDVHFGKSYSSEHSWRQIAKSTMNGPFGATKEDPVSSGAIQNIARELLADKVKSLGLLKTYDRFVITRADQYYACDLDLGALDVSKIWVPTGEDWRGICDRFVACSKDRILQVLNILPPAIAHPEKYYDFHGNIEAFVKRRWIEEGIFDHLERFRRTMFTAYVEGDKTRWHRELQKAFVEDGVQVRYKYEDEYYQALTSCENPSYQLVPNTKQATENWNWTLPPNDDNGCPSFCGKKLDFEPLAKSMSRLSAPSDPVLERAVGTKTIFRVERPDYLEPVAKAVTEIEKHGGLDQNKYCEVFGSCNATDLKQSRHSETYLVCDEYNSLLASDILNGAAKVQLPGTLKEEGDDNILCRMAKFVSKLVTEEVFPSVGWHNKKCVVQEFFINQQRSGSRTRKHQHPNDSYGGIFYLDAPKGTKFCFDSSEGTKFKNDWWKHAPNMTESFFPVAPKNYPGFVEPRDGDILLAPVGWLRHWVPRMKFGKDEVRTSVVFNMICI